MSLPKGWALANVEELAGPKGLVSDGDWVETKDQDPTGGVRLTQLADVGDGDFRNRSSRYMTMEAALRLNCSFLEPGDVLIARMPDPIGRACIFPDIAQPAVTAVDVMIWRTDNQLASAEWFVRWINSPSTRTVMANRAGGTTRQRIAGGQVKQIELPLPPRAEQRRIVAKLDMLTAGLARARAELDHVEYLQRRIRLSALSQIFAQYPIGSGERLDGLCRVGTGSTPKRGEPRYYHGADIPWVTSGVVNQRIVREPTELITQAAIDETNCKVFPPGSLLVALYGEGKTRGKVARLEIAAATNQALAVLYDFDDRVDPDWINLFLEGRYEETRNEAAGGVQPNLNLGLIKAIRLPLPPMDEQRAAIRRVNRAFARAERLEAEAARARALLDRLEAAILAKAFRGELVPQDPNDEPAGLLLERIRAVRGGRAQSQPKRGRTASVPKTPREKAVMTKSRQDEDVENMPYLANLIREAGGSSKVEDLFKKADLPVTDFYKQLAWEVDQGHIRDQKNQTLQAA